MSFEFLDTVFYDNTLQRWAVALAVGLATITVLRVLVRLAVRRLRSISQRTETRIDDLVASLFSKTKTLFLLLVGVFAGSIFLSLPATVGDLLQSVTVIALVVQGGIWTNAAIAFWLEGYRQQKLAEDAAAVTTVSAMGFVGKLAVWSVVLLLALDNLGVDVTTLVTGLGISGIAVALAVQNVLGDLLASLSIVLDKPFVIGDFLSVGDLSGTVEQIGLKTTRIRSLSGELLVFSNGDLLGSRIRNFGRMFERRVPFTIGVTYQTPREKLRRIPEMLKSAVEAEAQTRFDRSHFKAYGAYSIDFETVYYVTSPDYRVHMDILQAVNLAIHEEFEKAGIEFAYPTRTVFLAKESAAGA